MPALSHFAGLEGRVSKFYKSRPISQNITSISYELKSSDWHKWVSSFIEHCVFNLRFLGGGNKYYQDDFHVISLQLY